MLDFRVNTFLCVCKHLSFTAASKELCITQPAVSGHIKYIEEYYGVKLFNYENKKLTLTPEGLKLKASLETISLDIEKLKNSILKNPTKQLLKIGATKSIGDYILADALPDFISANPSLNVDIVIEDTRNLFELLNLGTIDFFLCEGIFDKKNYNYRFLTNENMYGVCSPSYPLPKIKDIESLFSEKLFVREPGSGSRDLLEAALLNKGFSVDNFSEVSTMNSPQMISKMTEAGCGISFVFDSVCRDEIAKGNLCKIKIPGFNITHEYNAVWLKNSLFNERIETQVEALFNSLL